MRCTAITERDITAPAIIARDTMVLHTTARQTTPVERMAVAVTPDIAAADTPAAVDIPAAVGMGTEWIPCCDEILCM